MFGTSVSNSRIGIVGLGYVGLPVAIEFGTKYPTIGFDINQTRIDGLNSQQDLTQEINSEDFARAKYLTFCADPELLRSCNTYIVTVPTPIDENNQPNCGPLIQASREIGGMISKGDVVIYESTVYPGATEEVCIPEIEAVSGLTFNVDFYAGYSPERINPGDKTHRIVNIVKVTSGSTPEVADYVDDLYSSIITEADTHKASSIRVAEAAKVIENTQRDLNIALINELAMIFERLDIDTEEVLQAAGTKWNFLPFRPGLVGGHCIGVDPYYLTYRAQSSGYHPEVILAGRRINDEMGGYVAGRVIKLMAKKSINLVGARVLVLGLAFKENCPDLRNTKVVDLIDSLKEFNIDVDVHDPWIDAQEARQVYGLEMTDKLKPNHYDAVVMAVAHDEFRVMGSEGLQALAKSEHVIFDIKHILPIDSVDGRL